VILLARALRYFGEAWLGIHLGRGAQGFLAHQAWSILAGILAVALAVFLGIRLRGLLRKAPPR